MKDLTELRLHEALCMATDLNRPGNLIAIWCVGAPDLRACAVAIRYVGVQRVQKRLV